MKFPHAIIIFASTVAALLCVSTVNSFAHVASSRKTIHVAAPSSMVNVDSNIMSLHAHMNNNDNKHKKSPMQVLGTAFLSMLLFWNTAAVGDAPSNLLHPPIVNAVEGSKLVGSLKGSGLVFKDTLQIERFNDPKVKGVVLYVSNFERPITEKISGKNFFNDPSSAGITCAKTGPTAIADNIAKGPAGEEVFEESKSLLFKTLRVQRIYDEETQTVVYVSFSTRLDKGDDSNMARFKSALCAVHLD